MSKPTRDRSYVLGTHDEEIARLGLQHRVWRPRALGAWQRAGFTVGQTVLDVGCGPGYATLDLADIVGPEGRVVAVDRSRRFLDVLEARRDLRGVTNVEAHELDLEQDPLPDVQADGAWCRWVLAFLRQPDTLLPRIARALRPGGRVVLHEYFDYATWRLAPRCAELEELVEIVVEAWRASGGEPDVGLDVPRWLERAGFRIVSLQPIIDIVPASNYLWQWPRSFIENGLGRFVELGRLTKDDAERIWRAFAACERQPGTLMITPGVVEVIAERVG